jgi:hypothetical protein
VVITPASRLPISVRLNIFFSSVNPLVPDAVPRQGCRPQVSAAIDAGWRDKAGIYIKPFSLANACGSQDRPARAKVQAEIGTDVWYTLYIQPARCIGDVAARDAG